MILCFVLFYNMPARVQSNSGQAYLYILLMYILTGTLDSLMNANYGALFPTLFKTDELRAKTNAIRQVCQLVAMVISIVLTPVVTSKIGYNLTAIIYGVIALAVIMFMTFGCHENIEEEEAEAANGEKPDLFKRYSPSSPTANSGYSALQTRSIPPRSHSFLRRSRSMFSIL